MKLETTNEESLGDIMVNQTFPDLWLLLFHSPLVIWAAYHLHPGKTLIRNKKKILGSQTKLSFLKVQAAPERIS